MRDELLVFQSMWAMERRHTDGIERSLAENIEMIARAGFEGVSDFYTEASHAARLSAGLAGTGLQVEAIANPQSVDDLLHSLDLAAKYPVHHVNIQPNVKKRGMAANAPFVEGWLRAIEQVDFPVYFETHRDRMTTDLFFTLDLLDEFSDIKLVADLSHFLVGREFSYPVTEENHALIHQILDRSWAFHGRVASREQIQIQLSYPHHKQWLDLFLEWWRYGFESWRKRRNRQASALAFTCELGPQPYAITGEDGNDTTDRWKESLLLRDLAKELWHQVAQTPRG